MKIKIGVMGAGGTAERLLRVLPTKTGAAVVFDEDPSRLLSKCLEALKQ